jgi:glycolate oxidase iron-sulfur subunit
MNEKEIEKQLIQLDALQEPCTGCGLCLEGCITYQTSGWEQESPRGRIQLAHQFLHGKIAPESPALQTFDQCLNCQACEPLCPQQVKYNQILQIVQEVRQQLHPVTLSKEAEGKLKQRQKSSSLYWKHLIHGWLAKVKSFQVKKGQSILQPKQPVLALCCQQDLFEHEVIEESLTFFEKLAIPIQISRFQPCCGKQFTGSYHPLFKKTCQKQSHLFAKWKTPETYFLSTGCEQMSGTKGLYQWIEKIIQERQVTFEFTKPQTFYYQPCCDSPKNEKGAIQRLMQQIKGLTVKPVSYANACCGGVKEHSQSQSFLQTQLLDLPQEMTVIVTSYECAKQWKQPIENYKIKVIYLIQLFNTLLC